MKRTFYAILTFLLFNSCYKDKGNYDYTSVGDIKISRIDAEYAALPGAGELEISPLVEMPYTDEEMEFNWVLYAGQTMDTIGLQKKLSYVPDRSPGTYDVIYYVRNKKSGHQAHARFKITMGRVTGHFILKETAEGNTELDLLYLNGALGENLLGALGNRKLNGKPRSMSVLYGKDFVDPLSLLRAQDNSLAVVTQTGKFGVYRASDMAEIFNQETMFFETKPNLIPYKFWQGSNSFGFLTSQGSFGEATGEFTLGLTSGKFGFNRGGVGAGEKWAYSISSNPLSAIQSGGLEGLVYWDETGHRLMYTNYNSESLVFPAYSSSSVWKDYPIQGENLICLYMGSYRNSVYAFIKNTTTNKLYRYTISAPRGLFGPPAISNVIEINGDFKLFNAKLFACNEWSTNVYYYVGQDGKTYFFNPATATESTLTFQGLPIGEEITYISNRYSFIGPNTDANSYFDYLVVATSNGSSYSLYMYKMIGGIPDGPPVRKATGTGKVKEVHFVYLQGSPSIRGIHWFSK